MKLTTRELGRQGERAAREYLRSLGYTLLCENYVAPHGEIDLILQKDDRIVFVEVKTRKTTADHRYGTAAAAVTKQKQRHIRLAANAYLKQNPTSLRPRLDVVEVYREILEDGTVALKIHHIPSAIR